MGILVALVLLPRIFGLGLGNPHQVFVLVRTLLFYSSTSILSGFSIYGYVTISRGMNSFILFGCEDYMLQFSFRWIQLQYFSIIVLMVVNLFRMAPPMHTTLNPDPPPPPPPPEAWQAMMAATNANT